MPAITSMAFPSAVKTMMAMLNPIAPVRIAPPPDWDGASMFVVRRIGGGPDPDDITDFPIMLVSSMGVSYGVAEDLDAAAQIAILSSVATQTSNGVLVDHAEIYVGQQEFQDVYPDERTINSTYRMGWRRQFRP